MHPQFIATSRVVVLALMLAGHVPSSPADLPDLPPGDVLAQDISLAPIDPGSAVMINWLTGAGGFGLGRLQMDFSIVVNTAQAGDPVLPLTQKPGYYLPDCDSEAMVPVPPGGALEGETGYQCTSGGDCHLIVHDPVTNTLFEAWDADISSNVFSSTCLATWHLSAQYGPFRRGFGCTSADAGGLPVAPLLIDPDEVANDRIDHAIRFILPNNRIRAHSFVLPATHYGGPSGPTDAPPYGSRLRLRADYPLASLPNEAARTIARALQTFGMVLTDGGSIALTARDDRNTTAKWVTLLGGSRDLESIQVTDFEVVDAGTLYDFPNGYPDCVREQPVFPNLDSDHDGLPDSVEDYNGNGQVDPGETDPFDADTDDDGLPDGTEDFNGNRLVDTGETDPLDADTDDDGLLDGIEDADGDRVVGAGETDPLNPDSDTDGLADGDEDRDHNGVVDAGESDPLNPDSDGDGLSDGFEVNVLASDPTQFTQVYTEPGDMNGNGVLDAGDLVLFMQRLFGNR